jgi:hypothetical protein
VDYSTFDERPPLSVANHRVSHFSYKLDVNLSLCGYAMSKDSVQSNSRAPTDKGLYFELGQGELNFKGQWCLVHTGLLCQEGYCSECSIFLREFNRRFHSRADEAI